MEKIKRKDSSKASDANGMATFSRHVNELNTQRNKATTDRVCRNASLTGKSEALTTNSGRKANFKNNLQQTNDSPERVCNKSKTVINNSERINNGSERVCDRPDPTGNNSERIHGGSETVRDRSEPIENNSERIHNDSERVRRYNTSKPIRTNSERISNDTSPFGVNSKMKANAVTHKRSFSVRREHTSIINDSIRGSTSNYLVRETTSSQLVRESTSEQLVKESASGQLVRETTLNHFVRESTFTKEAKTSVCDTSDSQFSIRKQELKSILKCSESKIAYHESNTDTQMEDAKHEKVYRCSYRLPVRRRINVQKAVSFRDDFVVRRFKSFDVMYASG